MLIGKYFQNLREAKELTQTEVAGQIRPDFEESLMWDFETGDDNDIDGWRLDDFKKYCTALGIDPTDFASRASSDLVHLPLAALVRARREEKKWSQEELADRIGYYPAAIEDLENEQKSLSVGLDVLRGVAAQLDIPFHLLLSKI